MSVLAAIQYTQGVSTAPPGQALMGTIGTPVVANNGDDSNVAEWAWEWVDTPPGSAVLVGPAGGAPTISFDPDVTGGYQLKLTVTGNDGSIAEDVRCFGVAEIPSGNFIPPFTGDSESMNFGGSRLGWDPYMRAWLQKVDALRQDYVATSVNAAAVAFVAGPTSYKFTGAPGTAYFLRIRAVAGQTVPTGAGLPAEWTTDVLMHVNNAGNLVIDNQSTTSFLNGHSWTFVVSVTGAQMIMTLTGESAKTVVGAAQITNLVAVPNSSA